jgi:tetratricopeptide (TPR) repeat protein
MRLFLAALGVALLGASASAGTYGEFNAGIVAYTHDDPDGAIAHFTTALAAPDLPAPYRATAYANRGGAHLRKKEWEAAIADLTDALRSDPSYLEAYEFRAAAYMETKHIDLAIADVSALIARKPFLTEAYGQRGELYASQQNYDAAISDFSTIITMAPEDSDGYEARGAVYRVKGDYARAMDDDDKAIDLGAKHAHNYVERGLVYEAQADYREAMRDFESAADIAPKDENVRLHLGLSSWEAGRFDEALRTFGAIRDSAKPEFAPYAALWIWLATAKLGGDSDTAFRAATSHYTGADWPRPVVDLYGGTGSIEAMLKAAADGDVRRQTEKTCEANFYGGAWSAIHRDPAGARTMLGAAAANCPAYFVERNAAAAELKRVR